MSTAKKFAKQTAIYGISTIASKVLNFFLTPLYTRAYPIRGYGILSTMYSYVSLLNAILAFGMETTFFRYLNKHADNKERVYNNAFASVFVVTVLFLLLTVPFVNPIADFINVSASLAKRSQTFAVGVSHGDFVLYVQYFIAILVLDAWCAIPFARIRAVGRPGRYGVIKLISVLVFIGFNLFFIIVMPFWLKHHFVGYEWISRFYARNWIGYVFLSELISSIVTLLLLLPELLKIRLDFDWRMLSSMCSYSWPVLIANISYLVNENLDTVLLGKLLPHDNFKDVAIYGACKKISLFLSIFINAFRLGAEPFFFNQAKNKNSGQTYARIMDYFVIAICLIFVGLIANIELLKYFIKGQDHNQTILYWTGLGVVPPLIGGYVSLGIYMNLSVWYKLSDQTKYGLYISGIGALLTIILNVILIRSYSYMASAWISLIAYSSMMVLSYIWGQKNYPIPYSIKKNLAYILTSSLLVYCSFFVFKRSIVVGNIIFILFLSVVMLLEWKKFKVLFGNRK